MAAPGAVESYSSLGAALKEVVADGIKRIQVDHALLQKFAPFSQIDDPDGLKYVQPTLVRYPDGFTHIPGMSGPTKLNPARSGKVERAEIISSSIYLVDAIDADIMDRTKLAKAAVKKALSIILPSMIEACKREYEAVLLYGRQGRAKISNVSSWNAIVTTGGVTVLTIDKAEWASGLWAGVEGMEISFYDSGNTDAYMGTANIKTVDMDLRTLTLDANLTTKLQTATGPLTVWRASTRQAANNGTMLESMGLFGILANTGVLFNIDAAAWNLYKSTQVAVGGELTLAELLTASNKGSFKGLSSGAVAFIPTDSWTDLSTEETTFRKWVDGPRGKLKIGADALEFTGASGHFGVKAHAMIKRGHGMLLNVDGQATVPEDVGRDFCIIGNREWSPEGYDGKELHLVPGTTWYEIRQKCNKSPFVNPPGRSVLLTGIADSQP